MTEFETSKNATIDNRIGHLVKQVSKMAVTMNELSNTVSTLSQGYPSTPLNQNLDNANNVWSNAHRTKTVRSSLVIKPVAGVEIKVLKVVIYTISFLNTATEKLLSSLKYFLISSAFTRIDPFNN